MMATPWAIAVTVLVLLLGLLLIMCGRGIRQHCGLGDCKTVSLDRITLTSHRLGMTGRPDRLIKANGTIIPEEWKSSRHVRDWHRAAEECKPLSSWAVMSSMSLESRNERPVWHYTELDRTLFYTRRVIPNNTEIWI